MIRNPFQRNITRHCQLLLCLIVIASILSCGPNQKAKEQALKQKEKAERKAYQEALKVGVLPTLDCLPIYLMCDSMLYDSAHADIRYVKFTSQMDCDTAIVGGSVTISVSDQVRVNYLKSKGTYLRYLTSTNAYWDLYVNKAEKIDSLSQLGDKIIAMTRFSITDRLTSHVIKKAKTKKHILSVQINDVDIRMRMLNNNEIDAAWLTEPYATQARLAGHKKWYSSSDIPANAGVFAYNAESLNKLPHSEQQMQEFVSAYNKAVELINKRGAVYYSDLLTKYFHASSNTIMNLPKIHFAPVDNNVYPIKAL